jgi:anti-sigma B factor antagonist
MHISHTTLDNVCILRLSGRIDHQQAALFGRLLNHHAQSACPSCANFLLDCADLEYISSYGLQELLAFAKPRVGQGKNLVLSTLRGAVRDVFAITHFDDIFPLYADANTALIALRQTG